MKNIILIGMPGAGKSTVGVLLAKSLGMLFADTDLFIQQATNEPLQETVDSKGIENFLKTEEEILLGIHLKGYVIATGGSAVLSEKGMENLKQNGIAVYLKLPIEEIKNRINNISTRGIAKRPDESLDSVFNMRKGFYERYADITVDCHNLTLEETVERIIENLTDT